MIKNIKSFFRVRLLPRAIVIMSAFSVLAACTAAGVRPSAGGVVPATIPVDSRGVVYIDTSKPIPFESHSFSSFCYSAYGCDVEYAGLPITPDDKNKLHPSSDSYGPDYQKRWKGYYLDIKNFPPPAKVSWRSKDGLHIKPVSMPLIFSRIKPCCIKCQKNSLSLC